MERGDVIIGRQQARCGAVLDVEHEEARVTPGEIEAIVIGDDLVALDDLRLAVGPVAIERPELLALALARNMPGADLFCPGRIAVVDDLQPFPIEFGRVLGAGIDVAVVGIEPMRLAVENCRNEGKLLRLRRVRDIME